MSQGQGNAAGTGADIQNPALISRHIRFEFFQNGLDAPDGQP